MEVSRDMSRRKRLRSERLLSISERGSYIISRTKRIPWANKLHSNGNSTISTIYNGWSMNLPLI
jgi:hypothetical protein